MAKTSAAEANEGAKPTCGIIMPIAAMPPKYDAAHWIDVRRVIDEAIIKADMTPQIVSDSFEGDVIQRRIISNLYDNPVVVCDVSGLNPNVMFELGMRITFKQPVVIITDDYATIPFDTKVIEHLGYPSDLHIHQTNEFIDKLADRIKRLHEQKKSDTFKSFIEEFGTFEVLEPTKKVVEADRLILDRLDNIERSFTRLYDRDNRIRHDAHYSRMNPEGLLKIDFGRETSDAAVTEVVDILRRSTARGDIEVLKGPKGQATIVMEFPVANDEQREVLTARIKRSLPDEIARSVHIRWSS